MPGPMSQQQTPWAMLMEQQPQALGPSAPVGGSTPEEQMASQMPDDIPSMTEEEVKAGVASGKLDPRQPVRLIARSKQTQMQMGPDAESKALVEQAQAQAAESYLQQKQGINQLEDNVNEMRRSPRGGIDYTPLVSMAKFLAPDSDVQSMNAAAQSLKPESPKDRALNLIKLQDMLQGHKTNLAKTSDAQLAALLKAQTQNSELATAMKLSNIKKNEAIAGAFAQRPEQFNRTIEERIHAQTLQSLRNNKNAGQKLQAIQGIDNAGKIIEDAPAVTPQIFHDYQQALVGAIMRGNSGVGERAERYMKSAGIDAATIKQYITGEPVDIGKNSNLIKAAQGFAKSERHSIQKQYDEVLNAATSGQSRIYDKNPALKADLMKAVQSFSGMAAEQGIAPQAGDEVEGDDGIYVFKGGDPQDQNNWEKK